MNDLEKSILKTIAFFDVFSYPLTVSEIWKWLYRPQRKYKLSEIKDILEYSLILKKELSLNECFYSLIGRDSIYLNRKKNNNLATRKFRRAIYLAKIYRFIPFVRMIAVCNSLAYSNANKDSDIDLFIITKRNTIWLARFMTVLFIFLFNLRPKGENKQDAFCLSFFIDESHLNIKGSMLHAKDIYYPYWIAQLMPIYNPDNLYQNFLQANQWYKNYLPNSYSNQFAKTVQENFYARFSNKITPHIICPPLLHNKLYNIYRRFQVRIIDKNLQALINVDTRVIVNERMLKFYPNDNRELFYKQWRERVHNTLYKYLPYSEQES